MIDFATIKNSLNMADLIGQEFPNGKILKAGRTLRCNPCPFCGHNDCFSFISNHYYCFSCDAQGDQVDLISRLRNLAIHEAAAYCANIIGVSSSAHRSKPLGSVNDIHRKRLSATPALSPAKRDELCRLRNIAADFYHAQLVKNKSALAYQTGERGHSVIILEGCRVGYTAGSLIAHAKSLGIDPRELLNIGLARHVNGALREYIPRDCFVYPHYSAGKVLFFTFKDPTKQHKFQIPKRREMQNGEVLYFADPGWVCFEQDSLAHDGCWLVEGENDRLSLLDAGETHVAATIGNFCTPEVTAWLAENARDRTYFLAFDNDGAGEKYTQHYSHIILSAGGFAKIVTL
ncbi:MAG: toprim domain-containing protein [Syntrophaceae bacterium]|nr:toprim domain-containing protein [Syntrophaceae bacterium]